MVGTFGYKLGYLNMHGGPVIYLPCIALWIIHLGRHFQLDRSVQEPKEAPADAVEGPAAENADATAVEALGGSNDGFIMAGGSLWVKHVASFAHVAMENPRRPPVLKGISQPRLMIPEGTSKKTRRWMTRERRGASYSGVSKATM